MPVGEQPFEQFVGQDVLKRTLRSKIREAIEAKRPLPHMLFCAPPESGKTTLAIGVAMALPTTCQRLKAADIKTPQEVLPFLTNAGEGSVLVIEDIDALPEAVCDFLVSVVEDCRVDIVLGEGINARTIFMRLHRFALIGTTSKPSRVSRKIVPWLAVYDFEPYTKEELVRVIWIMAIQAGLDLPIESVQLLAACSQHSLGPASILIKKIRGYFGERVNEQLTPEVTTRILSWLGYELGRTHSLTLRDKLCAMTGTEFEEFVGQVFRKQGYVVEFTGATGDHGIDLVMHRKNKRVVVQCKRWEGSVGEPVVRDFYGAMLNSRAQAGFIVTSGYFTPQAVAFAADKPIDLVDVDDLLTNYTVSA